MTREEIIEKLYDILDAELYSAMDIEDHTFTETEIVRRIMEEVIDKLKENE